jgi:hypothetical protein
MFPEPGSFFFFVGVSQDNETILKNKKCVLNANI